MLYGRLSPSLSNGPCDAKAEIIIQHVGSIAQARGATQEGRVIVKGPAALDAAMDFRDRVGVFAVVARRRLTPGTAKQSALLAPLPDVAVHVEQTEVVRLEQ